MFVNLLIMLCFFLSMPAQGDVVDYAKSHKVGLEVAPSLDVGFVQYDYKSSETPVGCERVGAGQQRCMQVLLPANISQYSFFVTRSKGRTGWFLFDWGLAVGFNRFKSKPMNYSDYQTAELEGMGLTNVTGPAHPINDFQIDLLRVAPKAYVRLGFTPPIFPELVASFGYGAHAMWGRAGHDGNQHFQKIVTLASFFELEMLWLRFMGASMSSFISYEMQNPLNFEIPEENGASNFRMMSLNVSLGLLRVVAPLPF